MTILLTGKNTLVFLKIRIITLCHQENDIHHRDVQTIIFTGRNPLDQNHLRELTETISLRDSEAPTKDSLADVNATKETLSQHLIISTRHHHLLILRLNLKNVIHWTDPRYQMVVIWEVHLGTVHHTVAILIISTGVLRVHWITNNVTIQSHQQILIMVLPEDQSMIHTVSQEVRLSPIHSHKSNSRVLKELPNQIHHLLNLLNLCPQTDLRHHHHHQNRLIINRRKIHKINCISA